MYILLYHRGKEGLVEGIEKLKLAYIVNIHAYQVLDLATVRLLQQSKAANIEWLEEVRRIRRYIERNDVILLVVELEFGRVVAFVTVEDQQLVFAFRTRYYIEVEVLDPI